MKSSIQPSTVKKYIEHMEDSFLINKACRYDLSGRKFISSSNKYYFEDMGLRNAASGFIGKDQEPHYMENIIYNELVFRGYNVSIGVLPIYDHPDNKTERVNLKIDFIAEKFDKTIYIQSALYIPNEEKMTQELRPLKKLKNVYKKVLITKYEGNGLYDEDGILHLNLFDFLLNNKSLD